MTLQELMVFFTTLSKKVESLETDLKQTKLTYGAAYTKLIKKLKKLENKGRHEHDMEFDFDLDAAKDVSTVEKDVSTAKLVFTAGAVVTTASRLQAELDKEARLEREREEEASKAANIAEWDDVQAMMDADYELAAKLQVEEQGEISIEESWKLKRDAEEELDQESSKRQKTGESSKLAEEPRDKEADELSQEELQQMMIIVPEQGMNVEALQTKYPIIDWEIYTEGTRKYWKIIRVGNHTEVHHFFDDMLKAFDRDDLVMLWSLVKEKFNSTEPTDDKEREIWVELKRLFEPDTDDELWKLQKHIHDLTWKLYDSCGVHHVSTEKGIDIYMLVEKEYPLSRGTLTLMLVAKLLVDQDNEMSRELLRKIFMQVERPRR
ncbi:hypothetical protein Tco_1142660 [Tanacetum coccineum]